MVGVCSRGKSVRVGWDFWDVTSVDFGEIDFYACLTYYGDLLMEYNGAIRLFSVSDHGNLNAPRCRSDEDTHRR